MKASTRKALLRATAVIDQSPSGRRMISRILARYYIARGASRAIVADALDQAGGLPIAATRSTMRWSAALAGKASMPLAYRPDRRLRAPDARNEALGIIDERLAQADDPELQRQRAYLLGEQGCANAETLEFVRSALAARLSAAAVAAPVERSFGSAAGLDVLVRLTDALTEVGMRPFLMSGTLLGVVREGALLDHDYDLDIGLLPGDGTAIQVAATLGALPGMAITVEDHRVWGRHRRGIDFDVFLHYAGDLGFHHSTQAHSWWNTPFALVEHQFADHTFLIPDDVDTYLSENYGNWRSPVVFFDKNFDTPNREFRQSTQALLYLYETLLNALGADRPDRFVVESTVRELKCSFDIDLDHHFVTSALLDESADISLRSQTGEST